MKVYIVMTEELDDSKIAGIFSRETLAMEFVNRFNDDESKYGFFRYEMDSYIRSFEIDDAMFEHRITMAQLVQERADEEAAKREREDEEECERHHEAARYRY